MLEKLWKTLEKEDDIDLQDAIKKAGLSPYEGRMAVRDVLTEFTGEWKRILRTVFYRKRKITELANSDLFGKIILLQKCESSKITPEGLDLGLWFEKLRYNKIVGMDNPLFDRVNPLAITLTYTDLMEQRNG